MSIVWCDLETTGLVPEQGSILEVACVITNDTFEEVAEPFVSLVKPLWGQGYETMDAFVNEMHTKSGLLFESTSLALQDKLPRRYEVETQLADYILYTLERSSPPDSFVKGDIEAYKSYANKLLRSTPLGGSSVHFDRRWLEVHMPATIRRLSHRHIDVSTLTELAQRLAPELHAKRPGLGPDGKPVPQHRALDDIRASITTLKFYIEHGFIGLPRAAAV